MGKQNLLTPIEALTEFAKEADDQLIDFVIDILSNSLNGLVTEVSYTSKMCNEVTTRKLSLD